MRSWCLGLIAAAAMASSAHAECKLSVIGSLATVPGKRLPLIAGEVNGHPTRFLADTGADITIMWRDQALKLGVTLGNAVGIQIYGVGGRAPVQVADIDEMMVGTAKVHNLTTYVVGTPSFGDVAMVLGNQFFVHSDVAFDLPEDKILMLNEKGCSGPDMIFWNKPYSQVPYIGGDIVRGAIYVTVLLNGQPVEAEIDSGASATVVDENLAARLGGETVANTQTASATGGVGFKSFKHHLERFKTFTLGDETIRNPTIQAAPLFANVKVDEIGTRLGSQSVADDHPRMLLGADFLRTHQLLISRPHEMIYFSYAGGTVFDVRTPANRGSGASTASADAKGDPDDF